MESNQQYVKYLKNSGQTIELFGLLAAIGNGIIFILIVTSGTLFLLTAALYLVSSIIGIVFVILGGRIRKGLAPKTKRDLLIVLIISTLLFLSNLPSLRSIVLLVPTILVVSSLMGLYAAAKLSKNTY